MKDRLPLYGNCPMALWMKSHEPVLESVRVDDPDKGEFAGDIRWRCERCWREIGVSAPERAAGLRLVKRA